MQFFITVLHVMLSVSLILIILLQPGKDGASVFGGGGSNQNYGPRGPAHFLGRATTIVAAMFMFTSITLAFYGSRSAQEGSNVLDHISELQAEQAQTAAQSTPAPEPTPVEPAPTAEAPGSDAPPADASSADAPPADTPSADAPVQPDPAQGTDDGDAASGTDTPDNE